MRARERDKKMNPEHPVIIIDNREQTPLTFEHFPSRCGTLQSGDYSLAGHEGRFTVERKSIADLIGSLTAGRERFERECHRLRGYDSARLLIVGHPDDVPAHLSRRKTTAKAVLGSLAAFEVRYRLPVVWEPSERRAAVQIEKWVGTSTGRHGGPSRPYQHLILPAPLIDGRVLFFRAVVQSNCTTISFP